ncbi:hypothetical protein AWC38_SpisGene6130 [Stylophora pistillata]|uniref:DED domain-containing protein n=2 Tax=Stylophora pistillata TaxID=50429 RepID=A0A2B4SIY0_STYPI|nr:hypothetical protein AWC38_SpisGene6130 [Stylophora pistillata]
MSLSAQSLNNPPPAGNYPEFNAFLVKIANRITEEELEEMKLLCDEKTDTNDLPRGQLCAIKNQREFLSFLRQHGKICPNEISYLVWLLRNVGCIELADWIEEQGSPSSPGGQPRNLPCLTTHFVGRDEDVDKIIKKVKSSRMVVILSIPGMGKTEVGVRVSHLLEQEGNQFVTHIRVESHHRGLEDVCSEILGRLSSRTWSQTADFVSLVKRKLLERNIPTVIVLDNTENIQDKEFDEFAEWLVKSAPNIKLLITTQKDVAFVSADVCKFRLKPLDPDSSAELLRFLVDGCNEEHSNELAKLCGGIPLLLVTCSDLLNNDFSPEILIQHLENNPIQLLKTNANCVYDTLKVFFTKFGNEVKQSLVLFSVFPSGFSAEDIQFLFEDPLHFQTVKTRMVKYALLQRDTDRNMRMHALVQAYFRAEKVSLGMGELWRANQRKFNDHYLGLLTVLSREFISKDSALVAIQKFRQHKANIEEALKNCLEDSSDSDDKNFVLDVVNSTEVLDFVAKVLTPPKECTMLYQKCCEIAKTSGDKKRHAESLNSLGFRRLCDVSHSKDSPEENQATLAKFQEAYVIRSTLPEEEQKSQTHAHTASKLGVCFVLQGDKKKGRKLIQEGILIREYLSDRLCVAAGYCDLGNSYQLCDDHQKAIDIWKENTLPVYKEQLGKHPWTASILSYIAVSYKALADGSSERGYIDQAEMYFREALELRKKLLGDHQDTARSRVQLSDVLVLQGQFDEALEELNRAFVIQNDILGPDHEITRETESKQSDVVNKRGSNPR